MAGEVWQSVPLSLLTTELLAGFVAGVIPGFVFWKALAGAFWNPDSVVVTLLIVVSGCAGAYYRYRHTAKQFR